MPVLKTHGFDASAFWFVLPVPTDDAPSFFQQREETRTRQGIADKGLCLLAIIGNCIALFEPPDEKMQLQK
jgi:hypothetical protein